MKARCLQYQKVLPDVREAQAHLEKIENHGGPLPSNYSLTPSTIAALRAAAATVYGANSVTISQHKGQMTHDKNMTRTFRCSSHVMCKRHANDVMRSGCQFQASRQSVFMS